VTDSMLVTAAVAAIPSLIIGVVGWLLRRLIADLSDAIKEMRGEMGQLRTLLGAHQNDLGQLAVRVQVLEREVDILRKRAA